MTNGSPPQAVRVVSDLLLQPTTSAFHAQGVELLRLLEPPVIAAVLRRLSEHPVEDWTPWSGKPLGGLGLDLSGLDLSGQDLSRLKLARSAVTGLSLRGALLWRAELCNLDLQGVDLHEADLRGAALADVTGGDLRTARIKGLQAGDNLDRMRWGTGRGPEGLVVGTHCSTCGASQILANGPHSDLGRQRCWDVETGERLAAPHPLRWRAHDLRPHRGGVRCATCTCWWSVPPIGHLSRWCPMLPLYRRKNKGTRRDGQPGGAPEGWHTWTQLRRMEGVSTRPRHPHGYLDLGSKRVPLYELARLRTEPAGVQQIELFDDQQHAQV